MEMTAVQKNQTIKEMSSQFTRTNPVMEVKIEKKILSGYATKTTLMQAAVSTSGVGILSLYFPRI